MDPQEVLMYNEPGTLMRRIQRSIYDTPVRMCMGPPPPKVIAVFYHGGPFGRGRTTTAERANTTGQIYNATESAALKAGKSFVGRVIAPGATSASGVANGLGFITAHYNRGDQIIIYAYSYGVDGSVDLAGELHASNIPVSLLITVDGSDGPAQNWTVNTNIPDNVDTNINYYQTDHSGSSSSSRSSRASSSSSSSSQGSSQSSSNSDSGSLNFPGSNGGPNTAVNTANVINRDVTASGTTHGNIQQKHQTEIERAINEAIRNYSYAH